MVCCRAKSARSSLFYVEEEAGYWAVCQEKSVRSTQRMRCSSGVQFPQTERFTPWTQTLFMEIICSQHHNPPLLHNAPNSLIFALFSRQSLRGNSQCSSCFFSLLIYLITSPFISLDKQIGLQPAPSYWSISVLSGGEVLEAESCTTLLNFSCIPWESHCEDIRGFECSLQLLRRSGDDRIIL